MGWSGGTRVFDSVVKAIIDSNADKKYVIKALVEALEGLDWDGCSESEYWEHPLVKECFIELGRKDWYED